MQPLCNEAQHRGIIRILAYMPDQVQHLSCRYNALLYYILTYLPESILTVLWKKVTLLGFHGTMHL